jgi:hypothetical protein
MERYHLKEVVRSTAQPTMKGDARSTAQLTMKGVVRGTAAYNG